jgi:hypothetical protein
MVVIFVIGADVVLVVVVVALVVCGRQDMQYYHYPLSFQHSARNQHTTASRTVK